MAERCQHLVARAKILVDGLRLGRRFDNDDLHEMASDAVLARVRVISRGADMDMYGAVVKCAFEMAPDAGNDLTCSCIQEKLQL